jgi:hypothetical protein
MQTFVSDPLTLSLRRTFRKPDFSGVMAKHVAWLNFRLVRDPGAIRTQPKHSCEMRTIRSGELSARTDKHTRP